MRITVFGANGGTGRLLVAQAADAGHEVTAVTRHPELFPVEHGNLTVFAGDATDFDSTRAAIQGSDVVLSSLGVPYSRKPISIYSVGTANLVRAMKQAGVGRLAVVSSSATDPAVRHLDSGGGFFFEKVLKPVIGNTFGKTLYDDMLRMENLVRDSDLDWTIVRPSGLFHTDSVTDYLTGADFVKGQYTSRADLADFLLRQASETEFVRRAAALITVDPQPTVMQLIRKEALAK
ncbi:MAG TPA: SDR family oxidoreductase [Galbitalea sp.]